MKRRDYEKWIRQHGWFLEKGGMDWKLKDAEGVFVCNIKITHPGGEVPKFHVALTRKTLKERGLE